MTTEPPAASRSPLRLGRGPVELIAVQRRLNSAATMSELLRNACERAGEWCGFSRALVLAIEDEHLNASLIGALPDPESDALRRRVLADPIALRPAARRRS